jgi:hypothetical protein
MLIFNHQLLHQKELNESQSIVVGFDSNEFHELCCSHLFCRIFNISLYKSISSDELEHIIARAHRDDRNRHIIRYIWSSGEKVPNGYDSEDSRRLQNHHQARVLGTNITISTALVNCEFLGVKIE